MQGRGKRRGLRVLAWVLLLALFLSAPAPAAMVIRYTRKKVSLYAEKSAKSRVLCLVPKGKKLRLFGQQDKWSLVSYVDEEGNRYKGYVLSKRLSKKKPKAKPMEGENPEPEEAQAQEGMPTPEGTPAPEDGPAPDGTSTPGNTPAPADVSETEDASDQEKPAPGEESDRERETKRAKRQKIIRSWAGKIGSGKGGLPIPRLFQDDYPETVCEIDGVERSVASSGCGAVCLSMVVSYMTGDTGQDPRTILAEAWRAGWYRGNGLDRNAMMKIAGSYGLLGGWKDLKKKELIAVLREGKPVIARMGFGYFTEGGHYIVLRGLTKKNKVLMNDPDSPSNSRKAFPAELFIKESKPGASFLVFTGINETKVRASSAPSAGEKEKAAAPEAAGPAGGGRGGMTA
ncbi:MAG: C39 family peptidase [Candidatus Excrementavichristensenella sp.]|jgi:hypothetical protein